MARLILISFFLATGLAVMMSASCPCDYYQGPTGNCYKVHTHDKYYCKEAMAICNNDNGWLVTIQSYDTQSWVNALYRELRRSPCNQYYWIGANDVAKEGTFVWHENGQPITYNRWNGGEPNNSGDEDCTRVNSDDKMWNDEDYNSSREYCFVCEKRPPALAVQEALGH